MACRDIPSGIDGVLFDLDGTLIRFSASYADFVREIAAGWGILDGEDPFFARYAVAIRSEGGVTFRSSVEAALAGRAVPGDMVERCLAAVEGYARGIEVIPGALEILARFEGLPKAIVSNGPSDMQRAAISITRLGPLFDHILISGDADVAVRKPRREIFLLACWRLGVAPERALMIGDNDEADVEGARLAGLKALNISDFWG